MSTSRKRFDARMERFYELIEQWGRCLASIKGQIDNHTFHVWYAPLKFRGINKRSLVLGVPNDTFEKYFKDGRTRKILVDAAKHFDCPIVTVYFRQQT